MVQDSDDSIIHKTYSAEHTSTLEARRQHLERLNSMPNMKVEIFQQDKETSTHKAGLSPLKEFDENLQSDKSLKEDFSLCKVQNSMNENLL